MFASELLEEAIQQITKNAQDRDQPSGERSMARTVQVFNALTGLQLDETMGWLFMVCVKLARSRGGGYVQDDYVDGAAYLTLAGECEGFRSHKE